MHIAFDYAIIIFSILFILWIVSEIYLYKKIRRGLDYIWLALNFIFPFVGLILYKIYMDIFED